MNLEARIKEAVNAEALGVLGSFVQVQKDAQTIVNVLRRNELPVDQKLLDIIQVGMPPRIQELVPTEQEAIVDAILDTSKPKSTPALRASAAKKRERAEEKQKEFAQRVLDVLDTYGPATLKQVHKRFPDDSEYAVQKALQRLKGTNNAEFHTLEFQGPTIWYSFNHSVHFADLKNYVHGLSKGEIQIGSLLEHFKLDHRSRSGINKMMRGLVDKGDVVKREGKFWKESPKPRSTNGRDHKSNFGGAGVATSGDLLSSDKEVRALIGKIKSQGAQANSTGGDHIKVSYMGKSTTIGKTPSSSGLLRDRENLKKLGLRV